MPALQQAWLGLHRARGRFQARFRPLPAREELIRTHAPGRSFADVGCMWSVDGAIAFLAEECGATRVTGLDVMPASERFRAEHARRGSQVRFLQGDLHDPALLARAGTHEVVWCSGVLYHAPHPLLTLERLASITQDTLILATETIPELPALRGASVLYPGLPEASRRAWARTPGHGRLAVDTPFDPAQGYGNWWWGITPSGLRGMLAAVGFETLEERRRPFHVTAIARRTPAAAPAGSAEGDLRSLLSAWAQAVKDRDEEALDALLAPEFTLTTGRQAAPVRTREEYLDITRERYVVEEFSFSEVEVSVLGEGGALVRSRYAQRGSMDGEDRSQEFLISDVLARRNGRWLAVSRHAIPLAPS